MPLARVLSGWRSTEDLGAATLPDIALVQRREPDRRGFLWYGFHFLGADFLGADFLGADFLGAAFLGAAFLAAFAFFTFVAPVVLLIAMM